MPSVIRPADLQPPVHATMPFRAWRSSPALMAAAHTHTDIEFNLPLGGSLSYFFAGRFQRVEAGHFAFFWAGVPHRLIALDPPEKTEYLCMTLPLGWFLSWYVGGGQLAQSLLSGDLFAHPASPIERALFERWAEDCKTGNVAQERIALMEVEAYLHRIALAASGSRGATPGANDTITGGHAERIAAYVGQHYQSPKLSVTSIAAAVDLNPHYALAVFKEGCGMTVWEYVTRLRISHAQRLLLTTDWGTERIAQEVGFISASRFFAVFRKYTGTTPRRYRVGA